MDDNTRDRVTNRYSYYDADRYRSNRMQNQYDEGNSFTNFISEHPVSAALIGAGVGLLIAGSVGAARSGDDSQDAYGSRYNNLANRAQDLNERTKDKTRQWQEEARDKASQYTGRVQGEAQHLRGRAQEYAQEYTEQAKGGLEHMVETHPLAVGAVAALVGAAIGFIIPTTKPENQMLGGVRDNLVGQAQERFRDMREVAEEAVSEAKSTLQEEADKRGLTPEKAKNAAQQAIQDGREAAQKAAERAKDAAQEAMQEGKEVAKKTAEDAQNKAKQEADKRNLSS